MQNRGFLIWVNLIRSGTIEHRSLVGLRGGAKAGSAVGKLTAYFPVLIATRCYDGAPFELARSKGCLKRLSTGIYLIFCIDKVHGYL